MDTTIPVSLRVTLLRTNRAEISIVAVYGLFCLLAGLILAKLPVPHLWVIALPLALLGLGWQITFILMPVNRDLDAVARSAVAGVLSLGVGGGCALFLARTNQGLHVETLLALLVSLSGLFTVLGLLRQPDGWAPGDRNDAHGPVAELDSDAGLARRTKPATVRLHRTPKGPALILLYSVFVPSWLLLIHALTQTGTDPPFTEFYLLDSRGYLVEEPVGGLADERVLLRYGIGNWEETAADYSVCTATGSAEMDCSEPIWLEAGDEHQERKDEEKPIEY